MAMVMFVLIGLLAVLTVVLVVLVMESEARADQYDDADGWKGLGKW